MATDAEIRAAAERALRRDPGVEGVLARRDVAERAREAGDPAAFDPTESSIEAFGQPFAVPDEALLAAAEAASPTHLEQLQRTLGPRVSETAPGERFGLDLIGQASLRGVAAGFADTPEGRVNVMHWLASHLIPGTSVFLEQSTGQPVMQLRDGSFRPLEVPGFGPGLTEKVGDVAELAGQAIGPELAAAGGGLASVAALGPGAFPLGMVGGAVAFEGLRQAVQEITGLDDETLDSMISTVGGEAFGQMIPFLFRRLVKGSFTAAGARLTPETKAALAAQKRLATKGIQFDLTPGELSLGTFGRLARQVNMLSARAQAFFGSRSMMLTSMLMDLPDAATRDQFRSFLQRDFTKELRLQHRALLEASGATLLDKAAFDAIGPAWREAITSQRRSTQAAVSHAYQQADELMRNAGLRENYFYVGSPGDEIIDEATNIRTQARSPQPHLEPLMRRRIDDEVKRAQENGVRGMIDSIGVATNPMTGESLMRTIPVREKLQNLAEDLYDISQNEAASGLEKKNARALREKVLAALEEPLLEPIPGIPGNPQMAHDAIETHKLARSMAKTRFEKLERYDAMGLTPNNPRPIATLEAITNARKTDDLLALAEIHGGLPIVRDLYFTELVNGGTETAGKKMLELAEKPEILFTLLGRDESAFQRVLGAAREMEALRRTGAWDALREETSNIGVARRMLFGASSGTRSEVMHQIQRQGGPNSELGRSAEGAVVAELVQRSLSDAKPGLDLSAEVFSKNLRQMEREGMLDFVTPRTREVLEDARTLQLFANMARPDSGSSLEAASTVSGLRAGTFEGFRKAIGQLTIAEVLALVLTNPKATPLYRSIAQATEPHIMFDLVAGAAGAMTARAVREGEPGEAQQAGIE